jgi:hypothetical protein
LPPLHWVVVPTRSFPAALRLARDAEGRELVLTPEETEAHARETADRAREAADRARELPSRESLSSRLNYVFRTVNHAECARRGTFHVWTAATITG